MRRKIVILVLGLIILIGLGSLVKIPTLQIKLQGSDQTVFQISMLGERTFYISFIHSVQKTPVREYYALAPENGFLLTAVEYSSYGAGLPFLETDGHYEIRDGIFVISEMNRLVPIINLIYFDFIQYDLNYAGKVFHFSDYFSPAGELVAIVRTDQPLWQIMIDIFSRRAIP